ncbi:MAG: cysteine desulfurase [Spirochaetaceae bacterium]|nr:MAG: cysteine desulfurase [Spirochaetaceae bacterium]
MSTTHTTVAAGADRYSLDVARIRGDFPILKQTMNGKPFVYLDNGATALKPEVVIDAEAGYYRELGANIHRGVYQFSETASALYDGTRTKVAGFIGAPDPRQVIFTKSATESVNLIAYGWALKNIVQGDEICVTEIEHHANFVPWQALAERTGATLRCIPLNPADGTLDLTGLDGLVNERTRLVAITAMSNVTGYMPPVAPVIARAKAVGALTVVDGAQWVSHSSVDVKTLDADFLVFSAHKMCGPTGVGVLYGREQLLEEMDPFLYGGDMVLRVRTDRTVFKEIPDKFEAGTPNIAGVIGFGSAIDYLLDIGMDAIHAHEQHLLSYAVEQMAAIDGVVCYGPTDLSTRGGILSFNVADAHPHDTGTILDQDGIAVRTGLHCAHPFMHALGVPGTTRASFYLYNTREEVDRLVQSVRRVREIFA